jgi:hypothetical protein
MKICSEPLFSNWGGQRKRAISLACCEEEQAPRAWHPVTMPWLSGKNDLREFGDYVPLMLLDQLPNSGCSCRAIQKSGPQMMVV